MVRLHGRAKKLAKRMRENFRPMRTHTTQLSTLLLLDECVKMKEGWFEFPPPRGATRRLSLWMPSHLSPLRLSPLSPQIAIV